MSGHGIRRHIHFAGYLPRWKTLRPAFDKQTKNLEAAFLCQRISIIPTGETEAIVLNVNPQTEITLDGDPATLSDLDGLGEGNSVTAYYYLDNLKATQIDAQPPPQS